MGRVLSAGPRLARSLVTLRAQIDAQYPGRSRRSDGWIADARHRAKGGAAVTQHVPNDDDVVCAYDFTEDLAAGLDCMWLLDQLDASGDRRLFYAIHDGWIENSDDTRTPYRGDNPHVIHLHVSVRWDRPELYDDPSPWDLPSLLEEEPDMTPEQDARLRNVEAILARMQNAIFDPNIGIARTAAEAANRPAAGGVADPGAVADELADRLRD